MVFLRITMRGNKDILVLKTNNIKNFVRRGRWMVFSQHTLFGVC